MSNNATTSQIVVFDFFCGCGGTSRGFQTEGLDIIWALDNNPSAAETFRLNFAQATFHCAGIDDLTTEMIEPYMKKNEDKVRLFCGCAPCQPFTKQRTNKKAKEEDVRFNLLISFSEVIKKYKPELVFVENVPGVQDPSEEPGPFQNFLATLTDMQYNTAYGVVEAQDYGAAQMRHRFIFMASRISPVSLPPKTHGNHSNSPDLMDYITVRQKIEAYPPIAAGETYNDPNAQIHNHRAAALSKLNLQRIQATPHDGGSRLSWPKDLQLKCHTKKREVLQADGESGKKRKKKIKHSGHTDVYGRLSWDRPAPGLTTRCNSYSNGRYGHPEQDRAISIREAASLQGFDDDFIFTGSMVDMAKQIGNAVPIPLAAAVGAHFCRLVEDTNGEI
jgi:DNA (cytosine-5)-methyltransferase 1